MRAIFLAVALACNEYTGEGCPVPYVSQPVDHTWPSGCSAWRCQACVAPMMDRDRSLSLREAIRICQHRR